MPDSNDVATRIQGEAQGIIERIRADARTMRKQRESVGPRKRAKLRLALMGMDLEQSAPLIEKLQNIAKHEPGESTPCASCKFLGGE